MIFTGQVSCRDINFYGRRSGQTQILACQVQYQADNPVALVLPLPVLNTKRQHAVHFCDVRYPGIFGVLASMFAVNETPLQLAAIEGAAVSYYPTLGECASDTKGSRYEVGVSDMMRQAYAESGIVLVRLPSTNGVYATTPFVACSFKTAMVPGALFFPTYQQFSVKLEPRFTADNMFYYQRKIPAETETHAVSKSVVENYIPANKHGRLFTNGKMCRFRLSSSAVHNCDVVLHDAQAAS